MNKGYESLEKNIEEKFKQLRNEFEVPNRLNSKAILIKEHNKHKPIISRKIYAICCLFILFCVIGTPTLADVIQRIFAEDTIDPGVIDAENNNNINSLNNVMESEDIKVVIKGVVSDGERIVLSVSFESGTVDFKDIALGGLTLTDSEGNSYRAYHYGQGAADKNMHSFDTTIEFEGSPKNTTEVAFQLKSINNIQGDWRCKFNVTTIPSKEFIINQKYNSNDIELQIDKIKLTATNSILEGAMTFIGEPFQSTLKNENGTIIASTAYEQELSKEFKMYFPTIEITNKLYLEIHDVNNNELFTMIINIDN